jgi:Fe-S cluster assembly protein SufB
VDAVFDSVSVVTTFKAELAKVGVIFCSISEAVREHPELVRKVPGLGRAGRTTIFATLNSAVFSDGSFVYIPPGVRCPMELSTYFRINAENTGQFERTLIIATRAATVLPGGLHRADARREPAARRRGRAGDPEGRRDQIFDGAELVPGRRKRGQGRHLQLRHQARRLPRRPGQGDVDAGRDRLGDHLEIPRPASCAGEESQGEFYSIAIANNAQQADTGTKMIHLGKHTKSRIMSKGMSAGRAQNTYRGLVSMHPKAKDSRNYHPVRQPADRRQVRGAHRALHRSAQQFLARRA